jgi:hypothetical protein
MGYSFCRRTVERCIVSLADCIHTMKESPSIPAITLKINKLQCCNTTSRQSVGVNTCQTSSEWSQDWTLKLGHFRMRPRRMASRWSSSVHVERNRVMCCFDLPIPGLLAVC